MKFGREKIAIEPPILDVTVQMAATNRNPLPMQSVFACVTEVKRHTHELEIVQCDGRHTFICAGDYTTYWYNS